MAQEEARATIASWPRKDGEGALTSRGRGGGRREARGKKKTTSGGREVEEGSRGHALRRRQ